MVVSSSTTEGAVDFAKDIRPIFSDTCFKCHGPDAKAVKGDLRLDQRNNVFNREDKIFIPGKPEESELFRRLSATDPDALMPPADSGLKLTTEQIATVRQWISEGAKWPEDERHWAFIPPTRPAVPTVKDSDWVRNPIDAFVHARLEQEHLKPSAKADKLTLLRRVTFDLTGLPPAPEE